MLNVSLPDMRTMKNGARPRLVIFAMCLLVVGCVTPPVVDLATSLPDMPTDFPRARYEAEKDRGESVYKINGMESLIRIFAYRAGSLSRLGHDHVIASRTVGGFALKTPVEDGRRVIVEADLYMSLYSLMVDDEQLRAEAGFGTDVSERARVGTRANMLASLDAVENPYVTVHIEGMLDNRQSVVAKVPLRATIAMHGVLLTIDVPTEVTIDENTLQAEGHFALRQSDFGVKPHSALGGALAVRDELDIAFQISATREPVS